MAEISFVTTQNVRISYKLGDLGERILGYLIDLVIQIIYIIIVFALGVSSSFNSDGAIFVLVILFFPVIFYSVVLEYFFNGQTVGKMVMRTKVIREDGGHPTFGQFLIRWLFKMFGMMVMFVDLIVAGTSKKTQRIGDLVAGTVVIKLKPKQRLEDLLPVVPEDDDNYQIVFTKAAELTDNDMRIIRDAYKNATSTGNFELLENLAIKTKQVLGIQSNLPSGQFIRTVIEDYNHFHSDPANSFAQKQPELV